MKSFLSYLRRVDRQAVTKRQPKHHVIDRTLTSLTASILIAGAFVGSVEGFLVTDSATAAPTRKDWCSTIWSLESNPFAAPFQLAWVNPTNGASSFSAPNANITMPSPGLPNAGTAGAAAIGIHKQSGTLFAMNRDGTGQLYKYRFGVDTTWQTVTTNLPGLGSTPSANLNKMTVDGNFLYLTDASGTPLYSLPLNPTTGAVTSSNATRTTYTYTGIPAGTPALGGGDITTDEYGDTYNITYDTPAVGSNTTLYFFKQDAGTSNWVYQGQALSDDAGQFGGAAFLKGDLYVKSSSGKLKKVDLTRSGSGYTGWGSLSAPGTGNGTTDLTACGTPNITITKTQQIYTDAAATTLAADQTKVQTGQYIKYIITAKNTGDAFARSANLADDLPIGTSYIPNSATLNGTNLGVTTYPTTGFPINASGQATGIIPFAPDPDTATLNFVVQVTALAGSVQNRATITYVDNSGLTSEVSNCTAGNLLNCGDSPSLPVETTVSGTVFNDTNGGTIDGTGTNAGSSTLTAYLVSTATTPLTIAKATVAANGTYSFPGVTPGSYTVRISNDATGAVGVAPPAASLPATYVNTGEGVGATPTTPDATVNGSTPITVTSDSLINVNFGIKSKANVILIKRITAIKDGVTGTVTPYNTFVDDTTSTTQTNDNHCNWPTATGTDGACTNTYTVGSIEPTLKVKPGDEIEYTIYYVNAGQNKASQVRICDQLDNNLTFKDDTPTTPSTIAPLDLRFVPGGGSIQSLTNASDTDRGQLTIPTLAGSTCNLSANTGTNLSNNVVVVDVGNATEPVMGSTGAGIPTTSYGYIRIKTTVK